MTFHYFLSNRFPYLFGETVQLMVKIMRQFLFQRCKLFGCSFHVSLKFGNLLQVLQRLLTLTVIGEITLLQHLLEIIVVGIRH